MMKFEGLYDIRDANNEDVAFITSTFLRGIYYGDSWFSLIPKDIFMVHYKPIIEMLLAKSVIKIACPKDDPSIIMGYSILSADYLTIHYVYVKKQFRLFGIARSLLPKYPEQITHLTELGRKLMNKFESVIFNPFNI